MHDWLIHVAAQYPFLVYGVVVILGLAEGPILSLVSGAFVKLGYFQLIPVYISLMLGDLIGDVFWYYIGRRYGLRFINRFGKYFSITEKSVKHFSTLFHKYKDWILIVSKISNGFGFAVLVVFTAGMVRVPFWRYMTVNIIGQFFWSGLLIGIGYFVTHLYTQFNNILGYASISAGIFVVLLGVVGYISFLKKKIKNYD